MPIQPLPSPPQTARAIIWWRGIVIIAALGLSACMYVMENRKESRSRPTHAVQGEWEVRSGGDLVGPGLRLVIDPQNARTTILRTPIVIIPLPPIPEIQNHGSTPFTILLSAYADVEGFMLDLATIALVVESAPVLTPQRVTPCLGDAAVAITNLLVAVAIDCYRLEYDRKPPSPSTSFTLKIPGLRRDGVPVELPPVHFSEVSTKWK